ncbi:MAG TPA: hypothetical protein VE967_07410 [Gemmatimonadaceae bacterium]|nr:hypothetical protein [Gemmatimonadaceae bacterium]
MKALGGFALATALGFVALGWAGVLVAGKLGHPLDQQEVQSVVMSGGIAFTVQLLTFGILRWFAPTNLMAGYGMGMIVRFLTLIFHGFIGVRILGLPMGAALLSLAAFLFLSTLIEPFFMARREPPPHPTE